MRMFNTNTTFQKNSRLKENLSRGVRAIFIFQRDKIFNVHPLTFDLTFEERYLFALLFVLNAYTHVSIAFNFVVLLHDPHRGKMQ